MWHEPGPEARDGGFGHHGELFEARAAQRIGDRHVRALEPFLPRRRAGALLKKRRAPQILRRADLLSSPIGRAADRHHHLIHEMIAYRARPMRLAEMDRGVEG